MLRHLRRWFGPEPGTGALRAPAAAAPDATVPKPADPRIATLEALWSEGFAEPGGAAPVLTLARMLDVRANSRVLLLEAGPGGAARALAAQGCAVTALVAEPTMLARARQLAANGPSRLTVGGWDVSAPSFDLARYDHAILMDLPDPPQGLLQAVIAAVRPGGGLGLIARVADRPMPSDPAFPSELAVTRVFLRRGCDIREVADIGAGTVTQALMQWTTAVQALALMPAGSGRDVLAEAERWRARVALLQSGAVRMVRWHVEVPRTRAVTLQATPAIPAPALIDMQAADP